MNRFGFKAAELRSGGTAEAAVATWAVLGNSALLDYLTLLGGLLAVLAWDGLGVVGGIEW